MSKQLNELIIAHGLAVHIRLKKRFKREEGQGLVEYALILALISILVIVALKFLQPQISTTLDTVANNL